MTRISEQHPLARLARLLGDDERAWLVGGAIRDELLVRRTSSLDYDIALQGNAKRIAAGLARGIGGFRFQLSDAFGAWRVVSADKRLQIDVTPLTAPTIEADLGRRDLTINAMARELLGDQEGELIDLFGGREDLERRTLRHVGDDSFRTDPLRVVRLARFVAELGFTVAAETSGAARASVSELHSVAAERVFTELRLTLCAGGAVAGLRAMGELGATTVVLPELEALRGLEQSVYHHLDVYEHTLATLEALIEITTDPAPVFPHSGDRAALQQVLAEPLANEMTRGEALRFGALLHDIAKPVTHAVMEDGRITFMGHDVRGAELTTEILTRLRAASHLVSYVSALTRQHLRLGFLVHQRPLSKRDVYDYLSACDPVEVDVTVLSVADRLATLGRGSEQAVAAHLELARELLAPALAWHRERPAAPLAGDLLAHKLGIRPGPELGRALAELTKAAYVGTISSERDAVEYARRWLADDLTAAASPNAPTGR